MPLNPDATNIVACTRCNWKRVLDGSRDYRGGHKDPATGAECNEMLRHAQLDPRAPEIAVLGRERTRYAPLEISQASAPREGDTGSEGTERAAAMEAYNAAIVAELADVYELAGDDVDALIADLT